MPETIELPGVARFEGGLDLDNIDLVLAYDEHFDGSITLRASSIVFRANEQTLIRAIRDALKQREKEARDEQALTAAGA